MEVQSYDQMLKSGGYNQTGDGIVDDLRKALATTNSGPGGIQSGPLMLENLDAVMTEVLITEQHFKLFNMLPKVPSAQPYYEYNVHKGFGSNRSGGAGFRQGGAPKGGTSTFERKGIYNKFLGVLGGITHQMLITGQNGGSFEDPTVRENRDRTLELLEKVERELVFGQSAIKDENGEEVNFDGLLAALTAANSANVIDMKGAPLTFNELDVAAQSLVTTGKQASVNGYNVLQSAHVSIQLDTVAAQDVKTAAFTAKSDLQAIVDGINKLSGYVLATRVTDAGTVPAIAAWTFLSGGSNGVTTNSDWQAAFDLLKTMKIDLIVPITPTGAIHSMADAHCTYMSGPSGKSERRCFVGGALQSWVSEAARLAAIAVLQTAVTNLNSDRTMHVGLGAKFYDADGNIKLYPGYITACMYAGLAGGSSPVEPLIPPASLSCCGRSIC